MDTAWCVYDDVILNLENYNMYREMFLKEYKNG